MEWLTLGGMLQTIRIGQKASTAGHSRTAVRRPDGLFWIGGILDGKPVEIRDYLFSDIWTIYEDEESAEWIPFREELEHKEREMIENQFMDERLRK
ncbi:hypothetical protein Q5741_12040 [Paenibacillus sp. JX-17]|uniref:Uncharacterized protein n=1 Tax=Paenibacillus lacisoli TaxID=3064525 RepID=A0ABT9CD01_9BACL|nr:hypothetical protein [Paenibacillus sp. JX-17]MDO7907139.1 hypothetical protein [Paenibacillus sp. JX-17]